MAKTETWYDSQANTAKLISYAALLVLFGAIGWAGYWVFWVEFVKTGDKGPADFNMAMISVIGGIAMSSFLYGVSAIIDLLIVQCEALRNKR